MSQHILGETNKLEYHWYATGRLGIFSVVEVFIRRRSNESKLTKNKMRTRDSRRERSKILKD